MILGGKIIDMAYCTPDKWIACLSSLSSITLLNIESSQQTNLSFNVKDTHNADPHLYGHITALASTEYGECMIVLQNVYKMFSAKTSGWLCLTERN